MTDADPAVLRQIAEALGWRQVHDLRGPMWQAPGGGRQTRCPSILTDKALQIAAEEWLVERGWYIRIGKHAYALCCVAWKDAAAVPPRERGHALLVAMRQELGI